MLVMLLIAGIGWLVGIFAFSQIIGSFRTRNIRGSGLTFFTITLWTCILVALCVILDRVFAKSASNPLTAVFVGYFLSFIQVRRQIGTEVNEYRKKDLEKQLIEEIKGYAGPNGIPQEDSQVIAKLLSAYNQGNTHIQLAMYSAHAVIEKYPELYEHWDEIMIKYKKLGLFPNWDIGV